MKFNEYLKRNKENTLSDYEKFSLYEKIISQQTHTKKEFRYFFSIKQVAYLSILGFLLFGIYGTYFLNNSLQDDTSITINRMQDSVSAGYIAKVIEFTGDFHIVKDNITLKTNTIENNDIVILKKGTKITFSVIDGSEIQMVGPAKFSINKIKSSPYRLNIQEGAFTSIHNTKENQDMEVIVQDKVTIKTTKHHTDFQITKKGKEYYVNNKGEALTISTIKEKNTSLEKDKVLTIRNNNDISSIQDKKQFAGAISNRDISQSFDLNVSLEEIKSKETNKIANSNINMNTGETLISEIKTGTINGSTGNTTIDSVMSGTSDILSDYNEDFDVSVGYSGDDIDIDTQVVDNLIDNAKIFNKQQTKNVRKALNSFFIHSDTREILVSHLLGDLEAKTKGIKKLNTKIIDLGISLGLEMNSTSSLESIESNVLQIKTILDNEYYIPQKYIAIIEDLITILHTIEDTEFDSIQDSIEAEKISKEIIN